MSESELIEKYSVSSITIKNAMISLCDKGYIVRTKGKGSFVNSLANLNLISDFNNSKHDRARANVKAIGLIIPTMKTSVDQELMDAIEKEISRTGYMLSVTITRESQELESAAIKQFMQNGMSGLIIFPTEKELYNEDILKLSIEQFPFVFIDRYLKGLKANTVTTNNLEITKFAVSKMIRNLASNLIFVSPNSNNSVTFDRIRGFEEALLDNNISINRNNFCLVDISLESYKEKYDFIRKALNESCGLSGIFCANQEMANIVSQIIENECDEKFKHLDLCCFDKVENKNFSFIKQNITEIAKSCVDILIDAIKGNTECRQIIVSAEYKQKDCLHFTQTP
jgi:DNA-binding LacI/PurR family transcriptional regulator